MTQETVEKKRTKRSPETKPDAKNPKPKNGKELVEALIKSGFIGMWADRTDIGDSVEFARNLRKAAERRGR